MKKVILLIAVLAMSMGLTAQVHTLDELKLKSSAKITATGRMHIDGPELLYVLNKSGMVISKAWGGNGNLTVEGRLSANYLTVHPENNTNEGGEILLLGAGEHNGWNIDNFEGAFRLHHSGREYLRMKADGTLGVHGTIRAKKVKVSANIWADYVFKKEYALPTLEEVAQHIAVKGHLKDIPSAAEVVKDGIDLGAMDAKLLAKIEELTLYMIEMNKKSIETSKSVIEMNKRIKVLESENAALKSSQPKTN